MAGPSKHISFTLNVHALAADPGYSFMNLFKSNLNMFSDDFSSFDTGET